MSSPLMIPLLWAQAGAAAAPVPEIQPAVRRAVLWFFLACEPSFTLPGLMGGSLTWIKAVGLLCLVGWVGSWLVTAIKERMVGRGKWYDYVAVAALIVTPLTVLVQVLQTVKQIPVWTLGQTPLVAALGFLAAGLFFLRFWKRTGDSLFAAFAMAFWLLGLGQAWLAFTNIPVEERSELYLLRLAAFLLILLSIWRKNRRSA